MSPIKPKDVLLLIETFQIGLVCGFILRAEVIAWADEIIKQENEPDHFFIELSLSSDTDTLLTLLNNQLIYSENPIPIRAALGFMYQKTANEDMIFDWIMKLIDKTDFYDRLRAFESGFIYELEYLETATYNIDQYQIAADTMDFLAAYKDFRLDNYERWEQINASVELILDGKADEAARKAEIEKIAYELSEKQRSQRRLYLRITLYLLALLTLIFIIVNYTSFQNGAITTKFTIDFYQFSIWYVLLFVCYHFVKGIYWVMMSVASSNKN